MSEIQAPRIQNRRQDDITKELISDYKNFEKYDGYSRETAELGKAHLKKMGDRLNKNRRSLIEDTSLKEKFPTKFKEFAVTYKKYENEITQYTKNLGFSEYMRHHKETLNKLGSIIDNYENEVIDLIKSLVDDMGDMETVTQERGNVETANATVKYVEIGDDGIYTLTRATNRPKIHQVLGGVLSPGEVRRIDYSGCTNASIKSRMINAISSSQYGNAQETTSCYLKYDQSSMTYVLSDGDGNVLQQRALIREGVRLTPPSKIQKEARVARRETEQAQINRINNINLSKNEQEALFDQMPKEMSDSLRRVNYNEFFQITEQSMNERIIEAKREGFDLDAEDPIERLDSGGYIMQINFTNLNAKVTRPLIKNTFSKSVRDAFTKKQLKKYLTARIQKKRQDFDYLTKRGSVLNEISEGNRQNENLIDENQKAFALKGLSLLGNWADAVADQIGNTRLKDDDQEFAGLKSFIRDAENDLSTLAITNNDISLIKNKLTQILIKFFSHNRLRSSMQINGHDIKHYIDDIISSGNKERQISAMRKIGASRTWFDNSQTAFLRDEIFEEYGRVPKKDENGNVLMDEEGNIIYEEGVVDLKDDNFEVYFKNINKYYQVDPENDIGENGEIKEPKKSYIDELYTAARECTGKHGVSNFKNWLVSRKLLPENLSGHGGQLDDKVRALKMQLEQQEKNANRFEITGTEIRDRTKQKLADLQLTLTKQQIQLAESGDMGENDEGIKMLNTYNFMLQQDDAFFQEIAKMETEDTKKSMKYCGVDGVVRGNLAPYLIRRGGGINSNSEMAQIYNDSVGAGGWLDYSDEGSEKVGPILKDIIVEVVITAVSILLSWNGAGEAIYAAFRAAKIAVQAMKGFRKFIQFMKILTKRLLKLALTQGVGKLRVGAVRVGKRTIGGAKAAAEIVRATETLGKRGRLAVKGTSLVIEGTTFHINSTIIHNIMNGEERYQGLNPAGYTEGPDGERIPNRQGYAQSIAFLGVLKGTGKIIGKITKSSLEGLSGREIQNLAKGRYGPAMANKILAQSLSIGSEMGSMMITDQLLSLAFEQEFKSISGEEIISMFGMIVGLRLNGKFQVLIKEHAGQKTTLQMTQKGTGNVFNVRIDGEGNILKVEGVDKNGNRILQPEKVCGLKAGENGMNLRDIPNAMGNKTGTIEGGSRAGKNLNNLNPGDVISVKHGEHTIKLKKTPEGKREVTDPGGSTYQKGTKFDVERNPNDRSFHLKNSEGRGTISLDGPIDVTLQSRFGTRIINGNIETRVNERRPGIGQEEINQKIEEINRLKEKETQLKENRSNLEKARNEAKTALEQVQKELQEIGDKITQNEKGRKELQEKENRLKKQKEELNNKKIELEAQRLKLEEQLLNTPEFNILGQVSLKDFPLKEGNKVSFGRKGKYKYIGIRDGKLTFTPENGGELERYSSFKDLKDAGIRLDIESRHELGKSQQEIFNKLVEREIAQGKRTELETRRNEIKSEIKNQNAEIKNHFENNVGKLKGKKIYIDGVEYNCSDVVTDRDGTVRLKLKSTGNHVQKFSDGTFAPENFSVTSFSQLMKVGVESGSGRQRRVSATKEWNNVHERQQNRSQAEVHDILYGDKGVMTNEIKILDAIEQNRLELNNINSEISQEIPQGDRVANPEYQRIQKEIERIDGLIKNKDGEIRVKDEELLNNQSDQIRLETELRGLKEQEGEMLGRKETAQQELNKAEDNLRTADQEYNDVTSQIRNAESELNNLNQQNEEFDNNVGEQEVVNLETEYNLLKIETQELKYHEKQIKFLKEINIELEAQLREMKRNIGGEIEIEGRKVRVSEELIEATERQLEINNKKLNEHIAKLGQSKGGTVNIEQNLTISILKSDFSIERILPDGTICKGDFGPDGNLVSGVKIHTDGSIEYGTYNERGELFIGMKEIKLPDGGYKQTYNTLDGIYEISLDANHNIVGNMEKIADSYHSPVQPQEAKSILNWFRDFKEDLKKRLENRRMEREQRAKEREEARARQLTYEEKNLLGHIIKEVPTLPENISKEYDLGNGGKIRIKKLPNGKFVEIERIGGERIDDTFIDTIKGEEMTATELEAYLKKRIIEIRNNRQGNHDRQGNQDRHRQSAGSEGIILVDGVIAEWGNSMEIRFRGEFYDNGVLKKGEKYLDNGLICESGEYDINGNMIKGEKYLYDSALYDHEGMPINGKKTTLFIGHEYLVSKKGEINRLGVYKKPHRGEYKYKDGSEFHGEVDNTLHPKQGKLTLKNGIIKDGDFVNGQLKIGIEISNIGGINKVKFIGNVTKNYMNSLVTHIKPGEMAEIELMNGEKITIKNIKGKFVELLGNSGGVEQTRPIEGKLGEYLEKRFLESRDNNRQNKSKTYPDGHKEIGSFDETGNLKEGLKITNNGGLKIEIIGDMPGEYIKTQINNLKAEIISNGNAEIKLSTGDIINVKSEGNKIYELINFTAVAARRTTKKFEINDLFEYLDTAKRQLINTRQNLKNLGINISEKNIRELSTYLTDKDFELLGKINDLGIDLGGRRDKKILNLTDNDIANLKIIKDLGIDITIHNFDRFSSYTDTQIKCLKELKNTLGIYIDITNINNLIKITEADILNLNRIKPSIEKLGISLKEIIEYGEWENYLKLTDKDIQNLNKIKPSIEKLGFSLKEIIKGEKWNNIVKLSERDLNNLNEIKQDLNDLNLVINIDNVDVLCKLTKKDISNIKQIKPLLDELGMKIEPGNAKKWGTVKLTENEIRNIKKNKSELDNLGIKLKLPDDIELINVLKGFTETEILLLKNDYSNYYEGYNYSIEEVNIAHSYKKGRIIEEIQQYIQTTVSENRAISLKEIIDKIRPALITLPMEEKANILAGLHRVVLKVNTVNYYLKNGPYRTPKELLCAMRGISDPNIIKEISDDITVVQHGAGMHFFVGDERSYQIIYDQSLTDSGVRSGGFNTMESEIKELEGTLSVGNSKNPGKDLNNYYYGTVWHEGQHNWNSYFMSDKTINRSEITRAKDEITAYLRDGRGIFKVEKRDTTIEQILTKGKSEGGLYTYGLEGSKWEAHKAQVRELLHYANDLVELSKDPKTGLTKDKIISMLSDVPAAEWKDLHSNLTEAVKLHLERNISQSKIISLKENFVSKIKERAGNNRLITDLINWWNSLFPSYGIHLEEFRRAGTATPETAINNVNQCKSIDEIKHVLRDPKYSHISRGPNNKGGIEISAIIDEVVARRMPITYIPIEIRPQVQKFIN